MLNNNRKMVKLRNLHPLICYTEFLNKKYIFCEAKFSNKNCFAFHLFVERVGKIFFKIKLKLNMA